LQMLRKDQIASLIRKHGKGSREGDKKRKELNCKARVHEIIGRLCLTEGGLHKGHDKILRE